MNTTLGMILGASLYAVVDEQVAVEIPYANLGAVAAIGATLLLIVGKYLPSRDKAATTQTETFTKASVVQAKTFADAIDKAVSTFAKSMDDFGERHDRTVLELTAK